MDELITLLKEIRDGIDAINKRETETLIRIPDAIATKRWPIGEKKLRALCRQDGFPVVYKGNEPLIIIKEFEEKWLPENKGTEF